MSYGADWRFCPPPMPMYQYPPREFTIEDKIREHEELSKYLKRIKKEIEEEKPKAEKKEEKRRWHQRVDIITTFLFMLVTSPFWAVLMSNLQEAALHSLTK